MTGEATGVDYPEKRRFRKRKNLSQQLACFMAPRRKRELERVDKNIF